MNKKNLLFGFFIALSLLSPADAGAQTVPTANFTIMPTPLCSGAGNTYTITDLSTGQPTAWSYTIRGGSMGPGPGLQPTITTVQNPTVSFNNQGTYTIVLIASNSTGSSTPLTKTVQVLAGPNANINPANSTNCIGGNPTTININSGPGSGSNTYSWSTGATTNSISVSPTVTTIYTCVISATNGCSVTRTATLTVSNPTITITAVPANICPGTTSTLTASSSGPGPYQITWSDNTSQASTTSSVAGVLTATVTNSQGCTGIKSYTLGTSTSLSLTANVSPSIVCAGNTGTLSVTGATSYTWNTGSSSSNPTINPTSNTNYTVSGTIGNCTGTAAISVSVNVTPTVVVTSNPPQVCSGSQVTLAASGASSYTWIPTGSNASSIVITPSASTNYTARGQNPGCPIRNGTINLVVSPGPVINIVTNATDTICAGEAVSLTAFGANSYTWSTGPSGAAIIVYPATTTTYSVTGANTNNCKSTASININVLECTSLNELNLRVSEFKIYPNPSNGSLQIEAFKEDEFSVYDLSGKLVLSFKLGEFNQFKTHIYLPEAGFYIVKSSASVKKLIIE